MSTAAKDPAQLSTRTEPGPRWRRYIGLVVGVGLTIVATFVVFLAVRDGLQRDRADAFSRDVALRVRFIQPYVEDDINVVRFAAARYSSSSAVQRGDYNAVVQELGSFLQERMSEHPDMRAVMLNAARARLPAQGI
ncbi:MAG: hypothetical protein Q8R28_19875 [Dehalococcoidia bacterium]|nr:hypothetical protein [Dehalococcoidia bacterium]